MLVAGFVQSSQNSESSEDFDPTFSDDDVFPSFRDENSINYSTIFSLKRLYSKFVVLSKILKNSC